MPPRLAFLEIMIFNPWAFPCMATDTEITSSLDLLFIFIFMGINVFVNESVYMCVYRIMSFVLMTFSDITDYHD